MSAQMGSQPCLKKALQMMTMIQNKDDSPVQCHGCVHRPIWCAVRENETTYAPPPPPPNPTHTFLKSPFLADFTQISHRFLTDYIYATCRRPVVGGHALCAYTDTRNGRGVACNNPPETCADPLRVKPARQALSVWPAAPRPSVWQRSLCRSASTGRTWAHTHGHSAARLNSYLHAIVRPQGHGVADSGAAPSTRW